MSEVHANFTREWIEFVDPANPKDLIKCDLTWLTSYWTCLFGNGCKGLDEDKPDSGCCSDGAYYSCDEDEERVEKAASRLTPDIWENYPVVRNTKSKNKKLQISEIGLDKERKTKKINDNCIFMNQRDFSGGYGCALHSLAIKEGVHFVETKPDVCWQLPIRRSFEERIVGDNKVSVTVIGEYERAAWGEGGADFDWYCTSNTEAHIGKEPVYLSNKNELIALLGAPAYQELARHCARRIEGQKINRKKILPLFIVHPATAGARK